MNTGKHGLLSGVGSEIKNALGMLDQRVLKSDHGVIESRTPCFVCRESTLVDTLGARVVDHGMNPAARLIGIQNVNRNFFHGRFLIGLFARRCLR